MPEPSPAPSPRPTPTPFATARSLTDRLPGVRGLPADVRPVVIAGIDLLLLVVVFMVLRHVVIRAVQTVTGRIAAREDALNNPGRASRLRTLGGLLTSVLIYTLGFIFVVAALSLVGVNVAGILGTAGVAGLAFGFGAQKLVKDVITGFFILLEDQYAVGEYVTIGTVTGTVEELAMRTTRIRDDDGKLYILSNGDIAQVCNQSRGPVAGSFEIAVAASADVARATDVLNQALATASTDLALAHPAQVDGISGADATKTTFKVSFRTGSHTRPAPVALRLRDVARHALTQAQIPLG